MKLRNVESHCGHMMVRHSQVGWDNMIKMDLSISDACSYELFSGDDHNRRVSIFLFLHSILHPSVLILSCSFFLFILALCPPIFLGDRSFLIVLSIVDWYSLEKKFLRHNGGSAREEMKDCGTLFTIQMAASGGDNFHALCMDAGKLQLQ